MNDRTIFVFGDSGVPSGYGRIADEIFTRLNKRGWQVFAASIQYDGLLPPVYEQQALPYWVGSLALHGDWPQRVAAMVAAQDPATIVCIQDAPYAEALFNSGIDWTRHRFIIVTPVDGVPIKQTWIDLFKQADGLLSISQFGVDAHRAAGVPSTLCRPGINPDVFYRMRDDDRTAIRAALGIDPDAFVMGIVAQNQGRKDIPGTMEGFFRFTQDKPNARLLINADSPSPAGWDLKEICAMYGWDASKILFREDCVRAGVHELRARYNVMDIHAVISHREGFGIPLIESQACGVATMALDYCSGTEVCGDGHGLLVKTIDYHVVSTWGGAMDKFMDKDDMVNTLRMMEETPDVLTVIAEKGMKRARTWTWVEPTDNLEAAIEAALQKKPPPVEPLPEATPMRIPLPVEPPA